MANFASVIWHDTTHALLLALHGEAAPSDAEWEPYLDAIPRVLAHPSGMGIVLTDGGTPSSAQRERMRRKDGGAVRCNAIITDNAIVRGVVTAVSWFNPKICAFAPDDFSRACQLIGLDDTQITSVCAAFKQLDQQLSPRSRVLAQALRQVQLELSHRSESA
jgi:hypothetical protein